MIAQELALVPEMSVAENLMLGREPVSRGLIQWDRLRAAAREALALVGSSLDPDAPVRALGVGQQQMIEIARALAKRSEILVLDEPTAALTESDARRLLDLVQDLRRRGVSSIYISHRLEEVFAIADRITVLRDGRSVATAPAREWTPESVIAAMVGREIRNLSPRTESAVGKTALEVEGWRVEDPDNPGRLVLDGVSFTAREGEVLGIAGLMGSGRTALVTSLFGLGARRRLGNPAHAGPGQSGAVPQSGRGDRGGPRSGRRRPQALRARGRRLGAGEPDPADPRAVPARSPARRRRPRARIAGAGRVAFDQDAVAREHPPATSPAARSRRSCSASG